MIAAFYSFEDGQKVVRRHLSVFRMQIDPDILSAYLAGTATEGEREALDLWRRESPGNEEEFRRITELWAEFGSLLELDVSAAPPTAAEIVKIASSRSAPIHFASTRRASDRHVFGRMGWRRLALVAACAAFGLLAGLWVRTISRPAGFAAREVVTGAGEMTTLALGDGTIVRLGPESRLSFDTNGQRDVHLQGRAFFAVASGRRDRFRVNTDEGEIVVTGTRFDVHAAESSVRVLVVEGEVLLGSGGEAVAVSARRTGQIRSGFNPAVEDADVYSELSWLGTFLAFEETTLADVAEEFEGRFDYNVEIADPGMAQRLLTGWFEAGSPLDVLGNICTAVSAYCTVSGVDVRMEVSGGRPIGLSRSEASP